MYVIGKNTIISSPAGAGKTSSLVRIFTELVKQNRSINDIVAITFTNKAAGEMKTRIIDELLKSHADVFRAGYFETGARFKISTIHSFLKGLIQVVAPEKTVSGELIPTALSRDMFEQIAAKKVRELNGDSILAHVASKRLLDYLESLFEAVPVSYVWAKEILTSANTLPELSGYQLAREFIMQLAQLFLDVLSEHLRWKDENGYFEYADIEMKAYDAVMNDDDLNDILLVFNEHMNALLVDEFQDTSELQWRILRKLAEDWLAGEGLREVTNAAVYLVGDPKQSIYSFRGADVSVMQKVMGEFEELASADERHFAHLPMKTNYRSAPPIVEFVNAVFAELMLEELDPEKPWRTVYEPFEACRDTDKSGVFLVVSDEGMDAKQAAAFEAGYIANEINRLIESGITIEDRQGKVRRVQLSDIAVLVRNRTHIDKYENALIASNIPFVSLDSGYTSLRPLEFLKSFFELFDPVTQNGASVALTQLIDEESFDVREVEDLQKLKFPFSKIYDAYHTFLIFFREGLYAAYRRVLELLQEILDIKFSAEEVELAVRLFDEVMAALDSEGAPSPYEVARRIKHSLTDYLPEISHSANAVQILSIHKAKGLEFPVVFAASLWSSGRNENPLFLPTGADSPAIATLNPKEFKEGQTKLDELREEINDFRNRIKEDLREFKNEEVKRLYYVAFTRARDYLYVLLPNIGSKNSVYRELRDVLLKLEGKAHVVTFEAWEASGQKRDISQSSKGFYTRRLTASSYHVPELLDGYLPGKKLLRRAESPSRKIPPLARYQQSIELGNIMHRLLQRYMTEGCVPEEEIPEVARPIFNRFIKDEQLKKLLEGDTLPEVDTIELLNGSFKKAKIDLLVFKNSLIRVVDYKTENYSPESVSRYRDQLEAYRRIISAIYPDRTVECYLVFLKDMKIEKLV